MQRETVLDEARIAARDRAPGADGHDRAPGPQQPPPSHYQRYHIETEETPDIEPWPTRFLVKVGKVGLAKLLLRELIETRGDMAVVTSRPCVYGVFSGPVGGFAPRPEKCVGCLRCVTEFPEFVEVRRNPERERLGDSFFTAGYVDAVAYEAATGRIPVKGAGYRGRFGGEGWDGMWTDMSEIVRPTRDGIHGREFISTVVDIGSRPPFLCLDGAGQPAGSLPQTLSIPLPVLFDAPPAAVSTPVLRQILSSTAAEIGSLAILPVRDLLADRLAGEHLVPLVGVGEATLLESLPFAPRLVELGGWDAATFAEVRALLPATLVSLRMPFGDGDQLADIAAAGVKVFHLTADYHGTTDGGTFMLDAIRAAHLGFVARGNRDDVTLLGSGGIIAAEHVPKAIIAGLDAVALDTPLLVALQARFDGEFCTQGDVGMRLPQGLSLAWGQQRLLNLMAAWRDQLLEVMGAMGLREVRRLRGEIGRAMFARDLEREAFAGIEGYE
ncbi:MAG: glutamate synthase-related protein [Anaerolineae bacterium]|nr:glutamate synthase-related protein [Anaerolineae bacterium]